MLKLYYSPGACALASHIAFEEAGADYEGVKIDLKKGEQKTPEYLEVNPAGVTPALATEQGVLTENAVIMPWIADRHPEKNLVPADAFQRARMDAFNGWAAASLHPALGRLMFSRPPLEGDAKDAALKIVQDKLALAEQHLLKGPFVLGAQYTVADGYLSVFTRWSRQAGILDAGDYPKLNAHLDEVQARPAVQRALKAQGIEPVGG
ncbi:glutathione S-transferase C-terminal domain-containing protein [Brevundimonas sp.]|uniref:glutathione S-transferase family protein n=1 Tax=Brevundimonas sp. TaxID=1871086 RepID=UPI001DD1D682|nr:glutathione S-transferase C-terminal domain-containing protein [Brevundimonas sp.]MBA3999889.1 glutathione S-transferase [Brevundimonas sp.]